MLNSRPNPSGSTSSKTYSDPKVFMSHAAPTIKGTVIAGSRRSPMTKYLQALTIATQYKLTEIRARHRHERGCIFGTYKPAYGHNGETYDVAIPQPCTCWLAHPDPETHIERLKLLHRLAKQFDDIHDKLCSIRFPEQITYRNLPATLHRGCNCWVSLDKATDTV